MKTKNWGLFYAVLGLLAYGTTALYSIVDDVSGTVFSGFTTILFFGLAIRFLDAALKEEENE